MEISPPPRNVVFLVQQSNAAIPRRAQHSNEGGQCLWSSFSSDRQSLIQRACTLTDPLRQRLYPPHSSARFYLVQQYSGSRCPVVSELPFSLIFLRYLILQWCQAVLSNEGHCLSPSICSSSDYELKTLPSAAILFFPPSSCDLQCSNSSA